MQETTVIEHEQPVGAILSPETAPAPTMTLCSYGSKLTREELSRVATPAATATHKPIPHIAVVEKLIEALSFRQIGVVREEYAISSDGMRMFGVMDLSSGFEGCRFALGWRNSHDKTFRLSLTVGLRVFVCENLAFHGDFIAVLAKHSKCFSLEDSLAIGVDRIQRNFGTLKQQVDEWRAMQLSTAAAKLLVYQAFIEEETGFPKHRCLVRNAGVAKLAPFAETSESTYDENFDINIKGAYFTIQKGLLLLNDGAPIILNTSVAGQTGTAGTSAYSATKAAPRSLARNTAAELAGRGIRVNTVAPGPIVTPIIERTGLPKEAIDEFSNEIIAQVPMKRFGLPEEVAGAVASLASQDAS